MFSESETEEPEHDLEIVRPSPGKIEPEVFTFIFTLSSLYIYVAISPFIYLFNYLYSTYCIILFRPGLKKDYVLVNIMELKLSLYLVQFHLYIYLELL